MHRSIVCSDIEGFGDPRRTDRDRVVARRGLYRALSEAFDGSGIPWRTCHHEDRGDGALILVPSEVPKEILITDLPRRLAAELAVHNRDRDGPARIRLRVAVHAGEIREDEHGVIGSAINLAFRLLDAEPFKRILAGSPGALALTVSDWFYTEVVRHAPRDVASSYRSVQVKVKETDTLAWVCLPTSPFWERTGTGESGTDDRAPVPRAPAPPPDEPVTPPRELPSDTGRFTGREAELSRLLTFARDARRPAGRAAVCAIDGMPGIGKTALAVHAAHRLADRFPGGCLFLDLHGHTHSVSPVDPAAALERMLRALGVPGGRIPHDADERAALYRSRLTGTRTLIVLDNATGAEQVRPLLPAEAGCLILVTSRSRLAALDDALPLSLDVLSPSEGVTLFLTSAAPSRVDDIDAVARIVHLCGRLPLAVRIAAARLRSRPAWSAADLAERLAERHDALTILADTERDVAAAFALSYRGLTRDQRRMFRYLGLHPGADADAHAAACLAGTTVARARRLCEDLLDVHLLDQSTPGRYRFHDLIKAFAARTVADEPERPRRAALTALFDHYLSTASAAMDALYPAEQQRRPHIPPASSPIAPVCEPASALAWLDAERPNLVAVCSHGSAHGLPGHTIRLAATLFRYLDVGAHLADAETVNHHARRAASDTGDRSGEAHFLTSLGGVQWNQGRYECAAESVRRALEIFREAGDRFGQARALSNLGIIYWRQGRYPEAADHSRRALVIYRASDDLAGQARALGNLCLVRWRQGEHQQAIRAARRALACYRALGDRRGEARILGNLGNVRHHQGRHALAVHHHRSALALYREIGDQAGEADALTNLGLPLQRQGHLIRAADHHRQALAMYQRLGDRNGQARALNGLGQALNELGHPTQARAHHDMALALTSETGDRYELARAHAGLALAHRGPLARHHRQQALSIFDVLNVPEAGGLREHFAKPRAGAS
ncbi:tetratricopeptide repeat protein [Actinomadura roseirufa]|uniref:tetratricopeptide repeat protein n=1 Tax=Actinomadura roseirufa TaxID=2094049 RepID=UPI0013F15028|nr:tetratricopeptide repeat protein [Actinomadura roseirufa]